MPVRKKFLLIISVSVVVLLLGFNIINLFRINSLHELYEKTTEVVLSESTANRKTNNYLNSIGGMLAHDLNTTRASLGLGTKDYPFKNISDDGPEDTVKTKKNVLLDAVDTLIQAELKNDKAAMLGRFLKNDIIAGAVQATNSVYEKIDDLNFVINNNGNTFVYISAPEKNEIMLEGFSGEELSITTASREAAYFIKNSFESYEELNKTKTDFLRKLGNVKNEKNIKALINNKILFDQKGDEIIISNIYNSNTIKAFVGLDGRAPNFRISGVSEKYQNYPDFLAAFENEIKNFDLRTEEVLMLDNARSELEDRINNEEFTRYMESLGIVLSPVPREDIDYIYYDLNYKDGKRLGSLSVLKKVGEVYLVDKDEVPICSLKTLIIKDTLVNRPVNSLVIPENVPQIDSLYSGKDTVTFVLVGNHERNTDTMIIVHANRLTGKAYLIGIPRDLYWKGRKINSIYLNYGAEVFKKELSAITGLDITNYVIVDMYAFIDIVNILGGIEVTLEEDLIDPTYKTRENGQWSTLNYKKGTYNLNGVEALRVARSRHGSNDFERSKRQQLIIEAFLKKISELGLTDADKVYGMMQALFEYIDTDFTLVELMSLYNNYSKVELDGKHVLSFDNILYDTYSNIYMLEDQAIEFDADFNKGAWILLPRENNWNNIRWYIRQIINGDMN